MPPRSKEYIDKIIRETVRGHMQNAGEPRPELLWTGIQSRIDGRERNGRRRSLWTRFALFKWQLAGIAAALICLLGVTVFFPEQLTALGKRVFYTAQIQKTDESEMPATTDSRARHEITERPLVRDKDQTETTITPDTPPLASPDAQPGEPHKIRTGQQPAADADTRAGRDTPPATEPPEPARKPEPTNAAARLFMAPVPETEEGLTLREARRTTSFRVYYPAYIPPGFTEDDISHKNAGERGEEVFITFVGTEDNRATIRLHQSRSEDKSAGREHNVQVGENVGTLEVTENDRGKRSRLRWRVDDLACELQGNVEPDEILKIAESLQP